MDFIDKRRSKIKIEKEKAPDPSEFETPEYTERRTTMTKDFPDFANNIPAHTGSKSGQTTTSPRHGWVALGKNSRQEGKIK